MSPITSQLYLGRPLRLPLTFPHWRCGGIPRSVSRELLLIKVTKDKINIYEKKQPYSMDLGRENYTQMLNNQPPLHSLLIQKRIQKIAEASYNFYKTS